MDCDGVASTRRPKFGVKVTETFLQGFASLLRKSPRLRPNFGPSRPPTAARLDPRQLETAFAVWVRSLAGCIRGVVAIDGKTVRGSKQDADGTRCIHNLHWVLDVAFREDECRVRKDHSARNLAMIRRAVLNMLRREPSKTALKRKRLKALINPAYRQAVLAG